MKNLFISFFLVATLSSQASASAVFLLMMGDVNGADEISLEKYKLVENTIKIHKDTINYDNLQISLPFYRKSIKSRD